MVTKKIKRITTCPACGGQFAFYVAGLKRKKKIGPGWEKSLEDIQNGVIPYISVLHTPGCNKAVKIYKENLRSYYKYPAPPIYNITSQ
jgi:hypothetical protein